MNSSKYLCAKNYLKTWNEIKRSYYSLDFLAKSNVKLRVFNHFYENLYVQDLGGNQLYVNTTEGIPLRESYHTRLLYTFNQLNIIGYYATNTHFVLCGPPDPITIIQSYKNNKQNTIRKLNAISNYNADQLIEEALKVKYDIP